MPFPAPDFEDARRALQAKIACSGRRSDDDTPHPIGCPSCRTRRRRSLQKRCLPLEPAPLPAAPKELGSFVPELADRLERDLRLTDGARRCARVLAAYTYRKHRDTRAADITVRYLAKALGKSRRTVQRYLRQLEQAGYIAVYVVPSERTRMCLGLLIELLKPLFARHHARKWPGKATNSGVTSLSHIYSRRSSRRPVSRQFWALRCMDGLWRSLMDDFPAPPASPRLS